jgi:hypothetical protein
MRMKKDKGMVTIKRGLSIGLSQIQKMWISSSGTKAYLRTIYGEMFDISEIDYRNIVREFRVEHDPVKNFKTEYSRKLKAYGHKNIHKHL